MTALWSTWLLATVLGAVAVQRHTVLPPAHVHALLTSLVAVYGILVSLGWLQTGSLSALLLGLGAALGLAWLAGVLAQGWVLWQGWLVLAMAGLTGVVCRQNARRLQYVRLTLERLEEAHHQATADHLHLEQSLQGLQRRLERYRTLQDVARQLSQSVALEQVARLIVTQTFQMVGKSSACLLFLIDRTTQSLALMASHRAPHIAAIPTKRGDAFDQAVVRTRRGLMLDDIQHEARYDPAEFQGRAVHAIMAIPLLVDRRVEGVLRLESETASAYTQEDLRLLDILAELCSTAIATARLYAQTQELAMTDGLTGLLVRRALLEGLRKELLRAERRGEARAVLMVDIDHFKRYNDALGHAAGDLVLKGVARILKEHAGPDGLVARYGGEEFTVVLHTGEPAQVLQQSERIRRAVEAEPFILRREATHVTISVGIARYPADGREPLELLRVADERLYRAKQAGRNRVCAA